MRGKRKSLFKPPIVKPVIKICDGVDTTLDDFYFEQGYEGSFQWASTASEKALELAIISVTGNEKLKDFADYFADNIDKFTEGIKGHIQLYSNKKEKIELVTEPVTIPDSDLDEVDIENEEVQEILNYFKPIINENTCFRGVDKDCHLTIIYSDDLRVRIPLVNKAPRAMRFFQDGWFKGVREYVEKNYDEIN